MGKNGKRKIKNIVLDADVVIDYLRQPQRQTVLRKLLHSNDLQVFLPAVCLTELYVGKSAAKPKEKQNLEQLVERVEIILANEYISTKAGILIRNYKDLYLADALVAASTLFKNYPLCTFNKSHFEKIKGLKLFDYSKFGR